MAKRRAKGEGSVTRRKDGRWQGSVKDPATGKRVYVSGKTQKETAARLAELRQQLARGLNVRGAKQTLGTFLAAWLAHQQPHWEPSTYEQIEVQVRLHITPYIGDIPLHKLSVAHLQHWQQTLLEQSSDRARRALRYLRQALNTAMRWELVTRNVANLVDTPKHEARTGRALTPAQVNQLLAAATGERYEVLFHMAVQLGMRQGELLALKWADLNLDSEQPTVTVRKGKTKSARRTLPLSSDLVRRLSELWQRHQQERLDSRWKEQGAVFATCTGRHLTDTSLLHQYKRLLRQAGLPADFTFHDLRHTAITRLYEAGIPPAVVQAIAGHSRPDLALSVYTHVDTEAMRRAVFG